jgi:hypothetical protein
MLDEGMKNYNPVSYETPDASVIDISMERTIMSDPDPGSQDQPGGGEGED